VKTRQKRSIISFEADAGLARILGKVPNRSEFIRSAVLSALDSACPLCGGTGTLSVDQRRHWQSFQDHHRLERCDDCRAVRVVCDAAPERIHAKKRNEP
jgi:hypothetical protein